MPETLSATDVRVPSAESLVRNIADRARAEGMELDAAQRELTWRLARLGSAAFATQASAPRSLYIYGPAGRGKSWIATAFFDALPSGKKVRVHFHSFFEELHRLIHVRREAADEDAVTSAVADLAGDARLLLFDEFHVHESGTARLLTLVLEHLFARDITVIATSNYEPERLLPNRLYHHTMEPGIALIRAHMEVCALDGDVDYRALDRHAGTRFADGGWHRAPYERDIPMGERVLALGGREFAVRSASGGELWIDFAQLCETATAAVEYLHWARRYPRWVILDIPGFRRTDRAAEQRFLNVVDVLVDADVRCEFVSDLSLEEFIAEAGGRTDAFRMISRLRLLRG